MNPDDKGVSKPPPWAPWTPSPPFSGQAIAAFVLSLLWLGGIGSIIAVFLAHNATQDVRRGTHSGQGLAVAALVLGILGIGISVLYIAIFMVLGNDLSNQFNDITNCVNSPGAPGCP